MSTFVTGLTGNIVEIVYLGWVDIDRFDTLVTIINRATAGVLSLGVRSVLRIKKINIQTFTTQIYIC